MNVRESRRTRHLVVRLDRGDEIPAAIIRALDEAEARSAWIHGVGMLEAAEVAVFDQATRAYGTTRRIEGGCEALHVSGNAATLDGITTLRLSAVLARETDVGLVTLGGQLVWGRAYELELDVTVLDDLTLTRTADERTGLPALTARPAPANAIPAARELPPAEAAPSAAAHRAVEVATLTAIPLPPAPPPPEPPPAPAPVPQAAAPAGPAMPQRPMKPKDDLEVYPEAGDRVLHFHFGECTVVSSDGDRIRLQQDRDGRVREVALTMLKIGAPETLGDGKKLFRLGRKH